jgi:hypothetical protein
MERLIGEITHYFNHLGVATIALYGELRVGDAILIRGYTTELEQIVCSLEIEHHRRLSADAGMLVAVKVDEAVRVGDQVYKLLDEADVPQNQVLWKSMRQALNLIQHSYESVFTRFMQKNGVDDHTISILLAALTFDPGTISPEKLQVRGPYTSAQTWMAWLFAAAAKGYLSEPEPGEFRLSRRGRTATQKLIQEARQAMQSADPLARAESLRLAAILGRLVQASLFTPPPPDTWSIRLAYQLMPADEPPFPYIDQALSCLQAYRDDAHLAAWQPSGVSAPALEALTLLWRGDQSSLEGIYDRLGGRGFALHDYQKAVDELQARGWVEGEAAALRVTSAGKTFRDQVEHTTDHHFFVPWNCLTAQETTDLACLLSTVRQGLQKESIHA